MAQPCKRPLFWQIIHVAILVNFVFEVIYAGYMVFVVVKPEGAGFGPLGAGAKAVTFEMMVTRRLYAAEFWIAFAGLAIYLAVTEMKPRFYARDDR